MRLFLCGTLIWLSFTVAGRADIELIGTATIPADATDKSGLTDNLEDGTPHNRLGSLGSGIAYAGIGNKYILVSDRGPKDGAVAYRCRMHVMNITVKPGPRPAISASLTGTTLLSDERNQPFVGGAVAFKNRLDPEGARVLPNGNIVVSDEYGPSVLEFTPDGKQVRAFAVPEKFKIAHPDADPQQEAKKNRSGRVPNRGFEGLAISPDGATMHAMLQSPLIQDGGRDGRNVRILEIKNGKTREFVYPLDDKSHVLNEILAVDDHHFLVIERDGKAGNEAKVKRIVLVDVEGTTDASNVPSLPLESLPREIVPVKKRPFLDLLDRKSALAGSTFPEKIEGLAFGPDLPDGRRLLLVTNDNDFKPDEPTWIYAFAIDPKDLPPNR